MKPLLEDFRVLIFLVITSILLALFDALGLLNYFKQTVQYLTIPIQYGLYGVGVNVSRQFAFVTEARFAAQQNQALEKQLGELLIENSNLQKQLLDAKAMIDQQNGLDPQTYNLLPAHIIGIGRYIIIDRGSLDGIKIQSPVIYRDAYVGQVKAVNPKSSEIMLITDPDSKIAVFSNGTEGKAKGILQGEFGSEVLMNKILHNEQIIKGDLVYSDGTEGRLPRGVVMGIVEKVIDKQNEVFKQAMVKPLFNYLDLDVVFVMKDQ